VADNVLWLNGREMSSLGLRVAAFDGLFGSHELSYSTVTVPGRVGTAQGAPLAMSPKELVVYGTIEAASTTTMQQQTAAVEYACGMGALVEIRTMFDTSRVVYGRLAGFKFNPASRQGIQKTVRGEIRFSIPSPVSYERSPRTYIEATANNRLAIPLGRLPSAPVLRVSPVSAAVGPFTITYRHADGTVLTQMEITQNTINLVLREDYYSIDCDLHSLTLSDNGTVLDGSQYWTPGEFILLNPADGDPESGAWPTLETSAGQLLVRVRRVDPV